jgi:hypothetical protein
MWGFLNRGTSKSTINHPAIGVPALEETPFYDFDISPKSFGVGYSMCNSCISEVVTSSSAIICSLGVSSFNMFFLKLKNVFGDHHRTSMVEDKQYVKPPVSLVILSC